jgi:hypothetical protein
MTTMEPSLNAITLFTGDMASSVAFYERVGLECTFGGADSAFSSMRSGSGTSFLSPKPRLVVDTGLATSLGNGHDQIATVEHREHVARLDAVRAAAPGIVMPRHQTLRKSRGK